MNPKLGVISACHLTEPTPHCSESHKRELDWILSLLRRTLEVAVVVVQGNVGLIRSCFIIRVKCTAGLNVDVGEGLRHCLAIGLRGRVGEWVGGCE